MIRYNITEGGKIMDLGPLIVQLQQHFDEHGAHADVHVIDKNSGLIGNIEEVKVEKDLDGDGSSTIFLVTEEM
jgi:hypothetical protein